MSLDGIKPNAAHESVVGELAMKLQKEIQSVHFGRKRGNINHGSMFASMPSNGLSVMVCDYIVLTFESLLISSKIAASTNQNVLSVSSIFSLYIHDYDVSIIPYMWDVDHGWMGRHASQKTQS